MKTNRLLHPVISGIAFLTVVTLSAFNLGNPQRIYHGEGGNASSCGSPGELGTCTRSGCHGAGATPAGLPDNAGPGTLTLTSVPAMVGNQYTPGQLYNMTVTVAQSGVRRFGFGCEILDNSGNTNGHINNTAGTVTVTDHINTRTWQAYGTGRLSITHDTSGGFSNNTYSFHFNWTAPNAGFGIVNVYLCGNASNNDLLADSADDIYSQHIILNEGPSAVNKVSSDCFNANVFPNPASNQITLQFNVSGTNNVNAALYSIEGKMIKQLENGNMETMDFAKTYPINDLCKGIYILKVVVGDKNYDKKIIIE
jgi:hypothetical protein